MTYQLYSTHYLTDVSSTRPAFLDFETLMRSVAPRGGTAVAYRQLYQVERGWRDLKGALMAGPVFHSREDRIRAHAGLCWLALLLIRIVENATGDSWRSVRDERGPGRQALADHHPPAPDLRRPGAHAHRRLTAARGAIGLHTPAPQRLW